MTDIVIQGCLLYYSKKYNTLYDVKMWDPKKTPNGEQGSAIQVFNVIFILKNN